MELFPTTVKIINNVDANGCRFQDPPAPVLQPEKSKSNSFKADPVTISSETEGTEASSQNNADKKSTNLEESLGLTSHDLTQLRSLKRRDQEVRNHEQAHLTAAGKYAKSATSFVYQKGPDGGSYAIGGEVSIDISTESSPEATIAKMQTIKRSALTPLNPSPTDRGIAAQAASKEALARQQLIREQHEILMAENSLAATHQFGNNFQSRKSGIFV